MLDKLREPGSGGGIRGAEDRLDAGRFRGAMEGMNEIDAKIAAEKNLPVRQDLMRLRKMISDIGLGSSDAGRCDDDGGRAEGCAQDERC